MTDDVHLRILRVVARGRARRLAAFDATRRLVPRSPATTERDGLARQSEHAQRELSSARLRRARQDD